MCVLCADVFYILQLPACVTWLHPAAKQRLTNTMTCMVRWKALQIVSQVYTELDQDPVPHALLRKYIAYARTHVHPVLSSEAKQVRHTPPA